MPSDRGALARQPALTVAAWLSAPDRIAVRIVPLRDVFWLFGRRPWQGVRGNGIRKGGTTGFGSEATFWPEAFFPRWGEPR